jgi:hypothetical protein
VGRERKRRWWLPQLQLGPLGARLVLVGCLQHTGPTGAPQQERLNLVDFGWTCGIGS